MDKLGARLHPMSGAGRIKADGSDDEYVYEVKDANKSYGLTANDLEEVRVHAAREGKEGVMIVQFKHRALTAVIHIIPTSEVYK